MKLSALLLFVSITQVYATGYGQERFSLNKHNISVQEAIKEIEHITNYSIFYRVDQIDLNKKVDIAVTNVPIAVIMEKLLNGQSLTSRVINNTIVIRSQQHVVTGVVTDSATGKPLVGVTVQEKQTVNTAVTDGSGQYSIQVASDNAVLEFTSIGYKSYSVVVGSKEKIDVVLSSIPQALDEVVVVGYGTQRKANLTGSVYQVGSKELANRPVNNIGQALQGLVPNLNVTNNDGAPNSMPAFNIRGGTSYAKDPNDGKWKVSNGSPYILVDGVEMDINLLNPEDIESISVLSDASSSAIYGARAAFGVILVTTKKGKFNQKANVTYSNMFQWNSPTARPDMLNSTQVQQALINAYGLVGQSAPAKELQRLDSIKAYAADPAHHNPYYMDGNSIIWNGNVNPYQLGVRNSTPSQKHNLTISGGGEKNSYYASLGVLDQNGVYAFNTDKFRRYNFMLNVSSKVTDWFRVDFKSNYTRETYSRPVNPGGKGGWWRAMSQEPARNVFMPLTTPGNAPIPNNYTGNILSYMAYGSNNRDDNSILLLTASPTLTPLKNWNIKADISYRAEFDQNKTVVPLLQKVETDWNPADMTTDYTNPSYISKDAANGYHYTINAYTDYTLKLNNHNLYGLVGFNQEQDKSADLNATGNGIVNNNVPVINLTSGQKVPADAESAWATQGLFYRFTYDYKGKYLLQSNGRYDMSSKFPSDRRGKLFPGVSVGWRVSQEDFMNGISNVLTDFKLRASYASLGNQNVRNYLYIPTYVTQTQVNQLFGGIRPVGITPPGLIDPNITWETATTADIGFDATFIKKLTVNFSWYNRKTTDILSDGAKYPAVLGAAAPTQNSGTLQSRGFDLKVDWHDVSSYGLTYNLSLALSNYKTTVLNYKGNPNLLLSTLYNGMVAGDIWGYQTVGIYQNQAEIDQGPNQRLITPGIIRPGDVHFKDLDGNDTISNGQNTLLNHGDQKVIGNSTPKYAFSLNSFLSYKNFDLNIYLQGVGKRDYYIGDNLFWGAIANGSIATASGGIGTEQVYNNSWTPDRPNALYPAYKGGQIGNITTQTRFLFNAAYLRLKNLSIGYTLPRAWAQRIAMQKLRISASGYNLLTFSGIPKYFDPETLSANYPIQKSVALSLQVTF